MSLLYAVVFASRCRSTHHRLAVDALRHMRGPDAEGWRNLLLHFHDAYLKGAKAPDDVFKDFKNHVLHVRDKDWGGAIEACQEWQRRTVRALEQRDWEQAAWSAGVLSHYYVDPLQPFHTHQTEEENVIHRAVEWSFNKSYTTFQKILEKERGGYPEVECPDGDDWLKQMVKAGAQASNRHYEFVIDHYDLDAGVKDPPSGLDQALQDVIAELVGHAAVGFSRILDRTFEEAAVHPPYVGATLQGFFLALEMPIQTVLKQIDDAEARKEVAAQYEEYRRTGKVRATLGEDDRVVRELYATEVLKTPISSLDAKWPRELGVKSAGAATRLPKPAAPKPLPKPESKPKKAKAEPAPDAAWDVAATPAPEATPPKPKKEKSRALVVQPEAQAETPKPERQKVVGALDEDAPVVDAPSIGPKTARRLEALGVKTVADLLALSAEDGETRLGTRHISAELIKDWQAQASLACTVAGLRSREAQALVACGVRDAAELAAHAPHDLTEAIAHWGLSDEGHRAWGNAPAPTERDVGEWIARAKEAGKTSARAA